MAKVTYRANVSILFEIEEEQAPEDLVSEALSENLQRNGVITDWHYIDGVLPQEVSRAEPEHDLWVFFRGNTVVYASVGAKLDEDARNFILRLVDADRCEPCPGWDSGDTEEEILDYVNRAFLRNQEKE